MTSVSLKSTASFLQWSLKTGPTFVANLLQFPENWLGKSLKVCQHIQGNMAFTGTQHHVIYFCFDLLAGVHMPTGGTMY